MVDVITLVTAGASAVLAALASAGAKEDNEPVWDIVLFLVALANSYVFLMAAGRLTGFIV